MSVSPNSSFLFHLLFESQCCIEASGLSQITAPLSLSCNQSVAVLHSILGEAVLSLRSPEGNNQRQLGWKRKLLHFFEKISGKKCSVTFFTTCKEQKNSGKESFFSSLSAHWQFCPRTDVGSVRQNSEGSFDNCSNTFCSTGAGFRKTIQWTVFANFSSLFYGQM